MSRLQQVLFGTLGATGLPSFLRRYHRGKAAILMYHSIVDHPPIAWTQVHINDFRRQMAYLRDHLTVLSVNELVRRLADHDVPPGAVAVTFDDGFENFASLAAPALQEFNVPATVYLTTSFIDGINDFEGCIWPDYVHALLLSTKALSLDLSDLTLPSLDLSSEPARHRAKAIVCQAMKTLATEQRLSCIRRLAERAGADIRPEYLAMFRGMSWEQAKQLDRNSLIDFGAHTVTHVILSQCPKNVMEAEILDSKRIVETKLGHPVDLFAYPNGGPGDYNENVLQVVRAHFGSAVTTIEGLASSRSDRYQLPRLGIGSDMFFSKFTLFVSGIMEGRQGKGA